MNNYLLVWTSAFDPDHPSTAFPAFTTQVLRSVASGLNISYHSLTNDLSSVNYSSLRAGSLEDREMYRMYQRFVIEHFMMPIFQNWLNMVISRGFNYEPRQRRAIVNV